MSWCKNLFRSKESIKRDEWQNNQFASEMEGYKYWTNDLIDWIAKENDPFTLSSASCLVNCHEWPDWLPSKPAGYETDRSQVMLLFVCSVCDTLKQKAEKISPGLHQKVWMSNHWRDYKPA